MPIPTLSGQKVAIIGGSSGIGYAVAEGALAEGAQVAIGSSNAAKVQAAVARLGEGASGAAVDVKDEASLAAFFEGVGAFDHLVYTAGDWGPHLFSGSIGQIDFATVGEGLKVRFWGAMLAIRHAQPRLSQNGSITLTDGILVHRPQKGAPLTAAFGGAIEHLARGLAVDMAPIRVNSVCPGLILTEHVVAQYPAALIEGMTKGQPLPRAADPAEAAQAYLYLMRAGYTTGQVLFVDGGRMLV
jgi:NAD(P)-dependent dehydrogenase (short-subunit alcohol dehydrogenase family)